VNISFNKYLYWWHSATEPRLLVHWANAIMDVVCLSFASLPRSRPNRLRHPLTETQLVSVCFIQSCKLFMFSEEKDYMISVFQMLFIVSSICCVLSVMNLVESRNC